MRVQAISGRLTHPVTVRMGTYGLAALGASVSSYAAATDRYYPAVEVWPLIPASILLALVLRRHAWLVLGVAAGVLAVFTTSETVYLWPGVAALTFGSLSRDRARLPWIGWSLGIAGSVVSLLLFPISAAPASLLAVALGTAAAIVLRVGDRTRALAVEASDLRDQASWLEQRTMLARELHDVVGHHVTAMVVQAEAGLVGDPTRALAAIGDLGRTALNELDSLVVHLRDPDQRLTITVPPRLADIDELLAAPLRQQGVQVRVAAGLVLDEVQTLTLYRIAQESLTNIARHARASGAWVVLRPFSDRVWLKVCDDGVGLPSAVTRGAGLQGIEERVHAVGGAWAIAERSGGGTVVDVFLPLVRS